MARHDGAVYTERRHSSCPLEGARVKEVWMGGGGQMETRQTVNATGSSPRHPDKRHCHISQPDDNRSSVSVNDTTVC